LKLVGEGCRIFGEALNTDDDRLDFKRRLLTLLWARRDGSIGLHDWLRDIQEGMIAGFIAASRTLDDEGAILTDFLTRMGEDEDIGPMTLGQFAGDGDGNDRINGIAPTFLRWLHASGRGAARPVYRGEAITVCLGGAATDGW
jgi:DNA helicase-2/ATP-dependent DNA helicase PcrA